MEGGIVSLFFFLYTNLRYAISPPTWIDCFYFRESKLGSLGTFNWPRIHRVQHRMDPEELEDEELEQIRWVSWPLNPYGIDDAFADTMRILQL